LTLRRRELREGGDSIKNFSITCKEVHLKKPGAKKKKIGRTGTPFNLHGNQGSTLFVARGLKFGRADGRGQIRGHC